MLRLSTVLCLAALCRPVMCAVLYCDPAATLQPSSQGQGWLWTRVVSPAGCCSTTTCCTCQWCCCSHCSSCCFWACSIKASCGCSLYCSCGWRQHPSLASSSNGHCSMARGTSSTQRSISMKPRGVGRCKLHTKSGGRAAAAAMRAAAVATADAGAGEASAEATCVQWQRSTMNMYSPVNGAAASGCVLHDA